MTDYQEPKITQINVDGISIGLRSLHEAFERVRARSDSGVKEELARVLIQEVRGMKNYIPHSAEPKYERALVREYRRFIGEPVEEETAKGLIIKVLGMGCPNCRRLTEEVMAVLSDLNLGADVEHVTEVNRIADYGAIGTPALIINGNVKSVGRVPSRNQIWEWINEEVTGK